MQDVILSGSSSIIHEVIIADRAGFVSSIKTFSHNRALDVWNDRALPWMWTEENSSAAVDKVIVYIFARVTLYLFAN